jgi:hypothetical protein
VPLQQLLLSFDYPEFPDLSKIAYRENFMNIRSIIFPILAALMFVGACTSKYNVVKSRNDTYLNTSFLTLSTKHKAQRQGGRYNSRSHVVIDYFRETKAGAQLKNELKVNVNLRSDDTDLNDKAVLVVNGKNFEIAVSNVSVADRSYATKDQSSKPVTVHKGGNIYHGTQETTEISTHNYKAVAFKITPDANIVAELKNPTNISARLYLGTEAITIEFDEKQIAAVQRFYNDVADEDAGQAN